MTNEIMTNEIMTNEIMTNEIRLTTEKLNEKFVPIMEVLANLSERMLIKFFEEEEQNLNATEQALLAGIFIANLLINISYTVHDKPELAKEYMREIYKMAINTKVVVENRKSNNDK